MRRNSYSGRKRGKRGTGSRGGSRRGLRYPTLQDAYASFRKTPEANVFGGRQEVAITPDAPLTAVAATAGQVIDLSPSASVGLMTFLTMDTDATRGDIEVESFSHNNEQLLVRSVPLEIFGPGSRCSPLVGRIVTRSDDLTLKVKNNNIADKQVYTSQGQEPWLGDDPADPAIRSVRKTVSGQNKVVAIGSDQGRTAILSDATAEFTVKANEPALLEQMVLVSDVSERDLEVTAMSIDNRNQLDGGSMLGSLFRPESAASPLFNTFVGPSDVIRISVKNNNAGTQEVQLAFTAASGL